VSLDNFQRAWASLINGVFLSLNLQHCIITKSFGFLIHPKIPFEKPNLRIADFATGTGIWLLDVAKIVSSICQLTGFDISPVQFPRAPETVPMNVSFKVYDILNPVPDSWRDTFDIIAVRFMVIALTGDEWERAVANMIRLLGVSSMLRLYWYPLG
jgi:ubiquinone/menaquinone biosynthesis C-methylase UbiE